MNNEMIYSELSASEKFRLKYANFTSFKKKEHKKAEEHNVNNTVHSLEDIGNAMEYVKGSRQ